MSLGKGGVSLLKKEFTYQSSILFDLSSQSMCTKMPFSGEREALTFEVMLSLSGVP